MGRELTMKALYQRDVGRGAPIAMLDYLCAEEGLEADDAAFARALLAGVLANLPELDRVIAAKAREWRLDRLANVDRNILRLGVYELTRGGDVPASVAINEAVELAKVYGGPESGRFVNGVLGQVVRELEAAVPEAPPPDPPGRPEPGAGGAGGAEPGASVTASEDPAPPAAPAGRRRRKPGSGDPPPVARAPARAARSSAEALPKVGERPAADHGPPEPSPPRKAPARPRRSPRAEGEAPPGAKR